MENLTLTASGLDRLKIAHSFVDMGSQHLVAILPGRAYTGDAPLLHYLRKVALHVGCDVLTVRYSFQYAPTTVKAEDMSLTDLMSEVDQAIQAALIYSKNRYKRLTVAGKSMGSPLAALWAQNSPVLDTRLLLLTPVRDAVKHAKDLRTLAIIGSADEAYSPAEVEADQVRSNVNWRIFDKLNHALEYEDQWAESIRIMSAIMAFCEAFLK